MKRFLPIIILLIALLLSSCAEDGLSAYDIAVQNGFVGTVDEWLASLKGESGADGKDGATGQAGLSAYQLAIKAGFKGTYEEWLASLKGETGEQGVQGEAGKDAPTVKNTYINEDMHLIVEMSDGKTYDAGYVGPDLAAGSGQPVLSENTLCVVPGTPYIVGCNLVGIKWESSDQSILRAGEGGLIIGVSEGEATLTATSHTGETATCKVEVSGYKYTLKADGNLRIDGYSGIRKTLKIPEAINGRTVDEIGSHAFFMNLELTEVILSDNIKRIGEGAFSVCDNLTSVYLGNSLVEIGDAAFSGCIGIKEIVLPESIERIGSAAFNSCEALKSIKLPLKVEAVEDSTFNFCISLESVDLGQVKSIGEWAFHDCDSLRSIEIPASVTSISGWAFADSSKLANVVIHNPNVVIGQDTFLGTLYTLDHGLAFVNVEKYMYATEKYTIRLTPDLEDETNQTGMSLSIGEKVRVTGVFYENEAEGIGWARIIYRGELRYVRIFGLSDTPPAA